MVPPGAHPEYPPTPEGSAELANVAVTSGFFRWPPRWQQLQAFGRGVCRYFHAKGIELFPKQGQLQAGPGSFIRLPFGVHHKSGRRYGFYSSDGRPLAPTLREQIAMLRSDQTVHEAVLEQFCAHAPAPAAKRQFVVSERAQRPMVIIGEGRGSVAERLKAAVPVRDFVLQYVQLSQQGRGLCPFHNDRVESFSVNDAGNYWSCFACGKSGSIIDFWMKWRECEFKTAVKELAAALS